MLKIAYFSSLATAVSTPLYLFGGELADLVVLGLLGATMVSVVLGVALRP